jgi:peroxiredoxin Q/BCP
MHPLTAIPRRRRHPAERRRSITVAALLLATAAISCTASPPPESAPKVGDAAPDFTVRAVTREGPASAPTSLAGLRGKTVVLAFFPRARTPGCSTQMKAYRDRYPELFRDGKDVVLLGVSTDRESSLQEWARDEGFPFAFVSDPGGELGAKYGALDPGDLFARRLLYVIAPDGTVSYVAAPFRQNSEEAYTELAAAIRKAAGA